MIPIGPKRPASYPTHAAPGSKRLLQGLSPRDERIHQLALRGISRHCRGDRVFNLKTDALQALLRLGEDEFAEIMRQTRAL